MTAKLGSNQRKTRSDLALILIGLFKLIKSVLLCIAGFGALQLMNTDVLKVVAGWTSALHFDPSGHYIHQLLRFVTPLSYRQLELLGIGSFVYAILFLIEGTGLLLQKLWAEYLTTVITSTFIPFEILELYRRFTGVRLVLLLVNLWIVLYLIMRIRKTRR